MKALKFPTADDVAVAATIPAGIKLDRLKLYSGANRYHGSTVLTCEVDFGNMAGITTGQLGAEFGSAFLERFQSLPSFLPNNGISDSFSSALRSGSNIDLAEVMLEAILAVEHTVSFAQHDLRCLDFAAIDRDGESPILIWETTRSKTSRLSAEVALAGVNELLDADSVAVAEENLAGFEASLEALREQVRRKRLAPATALIRLQARQRGIPCQTLGRQHLLLGEGCRQHHFYASMTDSTSIAAQKICADKRQTNRRLSDLRLPTPRQLKAGTADSAAEAAEKLGYPVVLKPVRGKKGKGVSVGLKQEDEVRSAFILAHKKGADVLVEEYVPGLDYRLLVIGGRFVAAVHRHPPSITGDGKSAVETLIDAENQNPYRDGFRGFPIDRDEEVMRHLQMAGMSLQDVPPKGQEIVLRTAANVSTGGLPVDVTDDVHPDNREMAEKAARGVGLDVAGIDFISPDIGRPFLENAGKIVEINARPGLDIHTWPVAGKSRDVTDVLLEQTFPAGQEYRLPVAIACGDRGTGTVARVLDRILRGARRRVALALRDKYFTEGVPAEWPGRQQSQARRLLLRDPAVDTLVSTVSLRQTAESGMKLESASVGIIMDRVKNGRADLFYLGVDIVSRAVRDCLIIGAGNLMVLQNLPSNGSRRLILVSQRASDLSLQAHLSDDGLAVTSQWHNGVECAVILSGREVLGSFALGSLIATDGAAKSRRLESAYLYAIAAAFALGLTPAQIGDSLQSDVDLVDGED